MLHLPSTSACLLYMVYEASHYAVWVVKMPDMGTETYGVINKDTGVIENLQPNIFNARALAIQFSKWVEGGDDTAVSDRDAAAALKGVLDAPAR